MRKSAFVTLAFCALTAQAGTEEYNSPDNRLDFVRDNGAEKVEKGLRMMQRFRDAGLSPEPEMCAMHWLAIANVGDNLSALEKEPAYRQNKLVTDQRAKLKLYEASVTDRCGQKPATGAQLR